MIRRRKRQLIAIIFGVACLAEAGIVIKLFPPSHPYATNAVALTITAVFLTAGSLFMGESWVLPTQFATWAALLYIIIAATVGGFLLYLFVLKRWTATGASYAFVLTPIVTVVLASLFTDETISLLFLVGAAVVLAGVYIGALMPSKKAPAPEKEPAPIAEGSAPVLSGEVELDLQESSTEDIQTRPGLPNCI